MCEASSLSQTKTKAQLPSDLFVPPNNLWSRRLLCARVLKNRGWAALPGSGDHAAGFIDKVSVGFSSRSHRVDPGSVCYVIVGRNLLLPFHLLYLYLGTLMVKMPLTEKSQYLLMTPDCACARSRIIVRKVPRPLRVDCLVLRPKKEDLVSGTRFTPRMASKTLLQCNLGFAAWQVYNC